VTRYSGTLPMRDASDEVALRHLSSVEEAWPADTGVSASSYGDKFKNGATLWPRRLVIVERLPATGRLGGNPHAPRVRGRTSSQDKKPWTLISPLEGPVEAEFLRPVLLGENIAPYRTLGQVMAVIPWNLNKAELIDSAGAYSIGKRLLAEWLEKAEKTWSENVKTTMTFRDQVDYYGKLSAQFPIAKIRVTYSKSGSQPAAAVIRDADLIIDNRLYYSRAKTLSEANYLVAILNSETARAAAEHWQSEGQWGKRDFDKAIFNLPIPPYDPDQRLHRDLAKAAERAEKVAARVDLAESEHFTRARARIRRALIADGVAGRIEGMVAELIGGSPPATSVPDDTRDD
jgi:hypothetical protein